MQDPNNMSKTIAEQEVTIAAQVEEIKRLRLIIDSKKGNRKNFTAYRRKIANAEIAIIINTVCNYFDVEEYDLLGKSRKRVIHTPRAICMYLCNTLTDLPLVHIGKVFSGRDHATIIHNRHVVRGFLDVDEEYRNLVSALRIACKVKLEKDVTKAENELLAALNAKEDRSEIVAQMANPTTAEREDTSEWPSHITIFKTAKFLGISKEEVRELADQGILKNARFSRTMHISKRSALIYKSQLEKSAAA